jgi:hypothetical protein
MDGRLGQPITGRNGDNLFIDIRLQQNPQPISSFGLQVRVDPAKLRFLDATRGNLTPAPGFVAVNAQENPPGSGLITCGGFGTTPIPINSAGVLMRLRFNVVCSESERSVIAIGGLIEGLAGLSGCCNIFECVVVACVSDGDVNGDHALSPGDAQCAFEIFLNGGNLPAACDVPDFGCEVVAADVNCDGSVAPGDALAIFQRFLSGLPPAECFARSGINKLSSPAPPRRLSLEQRIVVASPQAAHNEMIKLSLKVDNPAGIQAFGLTLSYPADKLEYTGGERASSTANWEQLQARLKAPGVLTIGGFDAEPLAAGVSDELVNILFVVKKQPVSLNDFAISQLVDDLNEATLKTAGAGPESIVSVPGSFKLYQNFPNPFHTGVPESGTVIRFDLPGTEAVKVEMAIYNLGGQLIRHLISGTKSPGAYEMTWDGKDEKGQYVPSGIYLYRLEAGSWLENRRMAVIR